MKISRATAAIAALACAFLLGLGTTSASTSAGARSLAGGCVGMGWPC
ncbi:hypothetical protein ACWDUI_14335 [Streptosporangium sandarakinum]